MTFFITIYGCPYAIFVHCSLTFSAIPFHLSAFMIGEGHIIVYAAGL
jgi:hypothetical protein